MLEVGQIQPHAEQYLQEINPGLWAYAYFPTDRYRHNIFKIVASPYGIFLENQELSVLEMLDSIWYKLIETWFKRL